MMDFKRDLSLYVIVCCIVFVLLMVSLGRQVSNRSHISITPHLLSSHEQMDEVMEEDEENEKRLLHQVEIMLVDFNVFCSHQHQNQPLCRDNQGYPLQYWVNHYGATKPLLDLITQLNFMCVGHVSDHFCTHYSHFFDSVLRQYQHA